MSPKIANFLTKSFIAATALGCILMVKKAAKMEITKEILWPYFVMIFCLYWLRSFIVKIDNLTTLERLYADILLVFIIFSPLLFPKG